MGDVSYLRRRLTEEGFDIGPSEFAMFPIMVKDNKKYMRFPVNYKKNVSL